MTNQIRTSLKYEFREKGMGCCHLAIRPPDWTPIMKDPSDKFRHAFTFGYSLHSPAFLIALFATEKQRKPFANRSPHPGGPSTGSKAVWASSHLIKFFLY